MGSDTLSDWIMPALIVLCFGVLLVRAILHETRRNSGNPAPPPQDRGIYIDVAAAFSQLLRKRYTVLIIQVAFLVGMIWGGPRVCRFIREDLSALDAGRVDHVRIHSLIAMAYEHFGTEGAVKVTAAIFIVGCVGSMCGIFETIKSIRIQRSDTPPE